MQTEKQKKWTIRNRLLWRLRGTLRGLDLTVCTQTEVNKILEARRLIDDVLTNSVESSRELGFMAKHRCTVCGKPIEEGQSYCTKCYNEMHIR